jgi:probable biosynthetic protein (TIGR04098 family)
MSRRAFSLEIGMPHLGMNNLRESALFMALGHDRWNHLQELGGVASRGIVDDAGLRLYATFFFVEVHLSPSRPLARYGENQTLDFQADLAHFGKSHLDGRYAVGGTSDWIRMSNVFIHQLHGPEKLAVGSPANLNFAAIPELESMPDSFARCREGRAARRFLAPLPGDVPLCERHELTYEMDPDRDLNGAGLVYFANFIAFLDRAERNLLEGLPDPAPASIVNARSTYQRVIGFYGNASATDKLVIRIGARSQSCLNGAPAVDFGFDASICRASDGKEIVVSSCRKIAPLNDDDGVAWTGRRHG